MKIKLPKFTVTKTTVAATAIAIAAGVPITDAAIDAIKSSEWQPKTQSVKAGFILTRVGGDGPDYVITTRL